MTTNNAGVDLDRLQSDSSVAEVFFTYRDRLLKMIRYRLDTRLVGRVDPEDLLQEVWFDVQRRISEFVAKPNVPFLLWLRQLTTQVLAGTHRRHLGTRKRDASLERVVRPSPNRYTDSLSIARNFVGTIESPSTVVAKEELIGILIGTLDSMEQIDKEIIQLRHLEELTNQEAAIELGIEAFAASKRYLRAMKRLTIAMQPVVNPDEPESKK